MEFAVPTIYHHGEKVVDLWGGIRNRATGEAWEEDTMFSATKGLAAMAMAVAHSRGWLDYEEHPAKTISTSPANRPRRRANGERSLHWPLPEWATTISTSMSGLAVLS
jgi:hypothetical protein